MYVDWVTYYDAAKHCQDLAADLRSIDKPVHDVIKGQGAGMAGDAPGCVEWAGEYDRVVRSTLQACTNLADALTNFGNILYAAGYNYGTANRSNPAPPRPTIASLSEHRVTLPSATSATAGIGVRKDADGDFLDQLFDEIVKEFKKLPNADIDALAAVSGAWADFAADDILSGMKGRLERVAHLFENMDHVDNRTLIQQHLATIGASADTLVSAATNIAAPVGEFNTGIHDASKAVQSELTWLAAEAAVTIGLAVVGFIFTAGGSGVAAAVRFGVLVARAMSGIRSALNSQKLLRILGFSTAFGGAVGVITAFDKVPDTEKVALALAEIIVMKVLIDEGTTPEAPQPADTPRTETTPTDRLKEHLTDRDLDAARRELNGEVVARKPDGTPWDHVQEVRDAQQGLANRIDQINRRLGWPGLGAEERATLEQELSEASRLLDHSEQFVPRN